MENPEVQISSGNDGQLYSRIRAENGARFRKWIVLSLFIGLSTLSTGCATLFASGPDPVFVSSEPLGASVKLDQVPVGVTPCQVSIQRHSEGVFIFELAGYQMETVDLDKVVNGVTFVNLAWILIWPMVPVGFAIDWASGHIGKYSTDPIVVILTPENASQP